MRRLLLATVAASALALTPFLAAAQSSYSPTPDTTGAAPSTTAPPNAPAAMPPAEAAAPTTSPDASTSPGTGTDAQAQSSGSYAGAQPYSATGASSANSATGATADQYGATANSSTGTTTDQYGTNTTAAPGTTTDQYGANANSSTGTYAANSTPSPEMVSLVQDMGLSGVPMTAQDVCAPRNVSLQRSGDMTAAQKVRFAVDYASVCKTQQVVIRAPRAQAARLERLVEQQGVPADMISTETASSSDATVQMTFAGLATSSDQYAALFNPQYAANAGYNAATSSDATGYSSSTTAPASTYNAPAPAPSTTPDAASAPAPATSTPYDSSSTTTDTPSTSSDMGGATNPDTTTTTPSPNTY